MISLSAEERDEFLNSMDNLDEWMLISAFKYESEIRDAVMNGNIDFVLRIQDYQQDLPYVSDDRGRTRPIKPWGPASIGFSVMGPTIDSAIVKIREIVEEHRDKLLIYFKVNTADIIGERISSVDSTLDYIATLRKALSQGNTIPRELYDV